MKKYRILIITCFVAAFMVGCGTRDTGLDTSISGTSNSDTTVSAESSKDSETATQPASNQSENDKIQALDVLKFDSINKIGTRCLGKDYFVEEESLLQSFFQRWDGVVVQPTDNSADSLDTFSLQLYSEKELIYDITFYYSEYITINGKNYQCSAPDCSDVYLEFFKENPIENIAGELDTVSAYTYFNEMRYRIDDSEFLDKLNDMIQGFGKLTPFIPDPYYELWHGGTNICLVQSNGEEFWISIGNENMINMNGDYLKVEHKISMDIVNEIDKEMYNNGKKESIK